MTGSLNKKFSYYRFYLIYSFLIKNKLYQNLDPFFIVHENVSAENFQILQLKNQTDFLLLGDRFLVTRERIFRNSVENYQFLVEFCLFVLGDQLYSDCEIEDQSLSLRHCFNGDLFLQIRSYTENLKNQ